MDDYEEAWETLRWNKRWGRISWLGVLFSIAAALVLPPLGALFPFLIIVFLVSGIASSLFVTNFKCPRCGNPFARYYWVNNPGTMKCMCCELGWPEAPAATK